MRHHNPGTTYRPDRRLYRKPEKQIKMLSSIIVVPPKMQRFSVRPTSDRGTQTTKKFRRPLITEIEEKWRRPRRYESSPPSSAWKQTRSLIPAPAINYEGGFKIVPGDAYQPVLWYENPLAKWPPQPLGLEEPPRPKFYHSHGVDPRSLDLRIRLDKLRIRDLREHLNDKRAVQQTPEDAVARLHGETWDPRSAESIQVSRPDRPATSSQVNSEGVIANQLPPPTRSGPPRRRRRCRIIIVSNDKKPQDLHQEGNNP